MLMVRNSLMIEKDELTNARSHVAVAIGTRDLPHSVAERKNTHFGKMGGSGIQPTLSCCYICGAYCCYIDTHTYIYI